MLGFFYIKYPYFLPCFEVGSSPGGYSTSARFGLVLYRYFLFPWHVLFLNVYMDALILPRYSAGFTTNSRAARGWVLWMCVRASNGCLLASVLRFVGIFWKIVVGSYLVGGVEVMLRNDFSEEMQVLLLLYPRASERKAGFPHGLLREEFSWAAHPNPPQSHVKGSGWLGGISLLVPVLARERWPNWEGLW